MHLTRLALPVALGCGLLVVAPVAAEAAKPRPLVRPVTTFKDPQFGRVLSTRSGKALYWWNRESGRRIRCTGSCARAWPPLIVSKRVRIPSAIRGVKGRFGTVRRPDGRRQVTFKGRPIYTYAHENRREVRCNNVNGWFVARARGLR